MQTTELIDRMQSAAEALDRMALAIGARMSDPNDPDLMRRAEEIIGRTTERTRETEND